MGLLLSVLVTCVGVVELLAFYQNVRRRVNYQPVDSCLGRYHLNNVKELETIRDNLRNQLSPKFRLNSHEDIEIEFHDTAIARSRSPSPRRFLVAESSKNPNSTTTRHFVVSEEPQGLQAISKSKAQECLPEFLIEESKDKDSRYVLTNDDGPVHLPLPEKFVVSEPDVFRKKLGHNLVEVDGELFFRRSPSPFPSFDLSCPRNSVCSELQDEASCLQEVDENGSKSPTPEPHSKSDLLLENSCSKHSSTQYWENHALLVPPRKSKSRSQSPNMKLTKQKSFSDSNSLNIIPDVPIHKASSNLELTKENLNDTDEEVTAAFSEEQNNTIDGVAKKKTKQRKKKTKFRPNSFDAGNQANDVASSSKNSAEVSTDPKLGEPFWVNR